MWVSCPSSFIIHWIHVDMWIEKKKKRRDAWVREGKWLTASHSKVKLKVKRRGSRPHNSKKEKVLKTKNERESQEKWRDNVGEAEEAWERLKMEMQGYISFFPFFFSLFSAWAMSLPCPGHVWSFKKIKAATCVQPCHTRVLYPVRVGHRYSTQNAMSMLSSLQA